MSILERNIQEYAREKSNKYFFQFRVFKEEKEFH